MMFSIVRLWVGSKGEEKHPSSRVGWNIIGRFSSWDMAPSPGDDLWDAKKSL